MTSLRSSYAVRVHRCPSAKYGGATSEVQWRVDQQSFGFAWYSRKRADDEARSIRASLDLLAKSHEPVSRVVVESAFGHWLVGWSVEHGPTHNAVDATGHDFAFYHAKMIGTALDRLGRQGGKRVRW